MTIVIERPLTSAVSDGAPQAPKGGAVDAGNGAERERLLC